MSEKELLSETVTVFEMESSDGELEEYVVMEEFSANGKEYAVMVLLEDVENYQAMTEEEFEAFHPEFVLHIMEKDGESYILLNEQEAMDIREEVDKRLENYSA